MMADKWIDVSPKDIIWDNIDVSKNPLPWLELGVSLTHGLIGWSLRNPLPIRHIVDGQYRSDHHLVRTCCICRHAEQCRHIVRESIVSPPCMPMMDVLSEGVDGLHSWLCWIRNAPTPVPGIIQGILPPLFLAILFAILPWLLKGMSLFISLGFNFLTTR